MPDHLHLLLTPGNTTTLEQGMQLIKGGSSYEIHQLRGHTMQIWQPGFHDYTIRDMADYQARREYVRMNPVQARLTARPEDWLYGSASTRFLLDELPQKLK
jgi:putative transposase